MYQIVRIDLPSPVLAINGGLEAFLIFALAGITLPVKI